MYHYVRDVDRGPKVNALGIDDFNAQLQWLARTRRVVSWEEFDAALTARRPLDGTALLTFDDGFVDHFEIVYPALRRRAWSGVFFLTGATLTQPGRLLNVHRTHWLIAYLGQDAFATAVREALDRQPVTVAARAARTADVYRYDVQAGDAADVKHLLNYELPPEIVDRLLEELFDQHIGDEAAVARSLYLSHDQVREMAAGGMTFGFHTERHRVLSQLSASEQDAELATGVDRVRALTGQRSVPFCYPFGHVHTYNDTTQRLLRECGYASAFCTTRRLTRTESDPIYELPRYDTRDLPPFAEAPVA